MVHREVTFPKILYLKRNIRFFTGKICSIRPKEIHLRLYVLLGSVRKTREYVREGMRRKEVDYRDALQLEV